MKRFIHLVAIAAMFIGLSAFGGCASTPNNAQTGVFAVQQQYNHALAVGAWYGKLESCNAPTHDPIFCSDPAIVIKIEQATDVASPAIKAAQATVRNPAFDNSAVDQINLSAQAALSVLTAITGPLEGLFAKAVAAGKAQAMIASPAEMSALASTAVIPLAYILSLLGFLLKTLPEGTAAWLKFKADKDKLDAIVAEDRVPTDDEWASLNFETADLEQQIHDNADRARGEG